MIATVVIVALGILSALAASALYRQRRISQSLAARLAAAEADLHHLQESCSQLAPAGVVQRLADRGTTSPSVERKVATALFVDLVGFTALSERLDPVLLARVLNEYFQRMSDVIHAHGGHVSTFLGDGILAYFGALQSNPWQSDDAVCAALAMRDTICDYNNELAREHLPPLAIGIGIHRGTGLAGLIGSRERKEFGFIGRTVNVAARVQALTRTHDVDILVTEALRGNLDSRFVLDPMPAETVKGIAEPVVTYAVRATA